MLDTFRSTNAQLEVAIWSLSGAEARGLFFNVKASGIIEVETGLGFSFDGFCCSQ